MTSRKEANTGECRDDRSAQGTDSHPGDFLCTLLFSAFRSRSDHVGLEEGSFNDKLVVKHSLHDNCKDVFRDFSTSVDIVSTINQNFWLDDGHKSVVLADTTITGESMCSLVNRELRGATIRSNLKNSSPLGKSASLFVEGFASSSKTIKTLSGLLPVGSSNFDGPLVDLNTSDDTARSEVFNEVDSILGLLVEGLLEHDDTTDVVVHFRGSEEELTVSASVVLGVLDVDACKALSNSSSALISSKDTLSRGGDFLCSIDQIGRAHV